MDLGLKKLFGNGSLPPEISGELRTTLLKMRHERTAFEALATRVHETLGGAEVIAAPVEQMRDSVDELRAQVTTLQAATSNVSELEARLADMEGRLQGASDTADMLRELLAHAEEDVGKTVSDVRSASADLETIHQGLGDVSAAKAAAADFLAMRKDVAAVREELAALQVHASTLTRERDEFRAQHDAMAAENRTVRAQLQQTVDQFSTLQADVAEAAQRVDSLRPTIEPVAELVRGVPEARRELQMLQALREVVAGKLAGLEEQRDLVERVAERGERLELMLHRLDAELQHHSGDHAAITELREHVAALTSEHATIAEDGDRIRRTHDELRALEEATRKDVQSFQAQVTNDIERAASRFAIEREGLDGVSERVAALRAALVDAEQRFDGLDEASLLVDEVRTDVGHLRELVTEVERDISGLALQGERVRDLEQRVHPLETATSELTKKLDAVREPSEVAITRAERRVQELTAQVEVLEGRAEQLEGAAAVMRTLGQEIDRQRLTVEGALASLHQAAELEVNAGTAVQSLSDQAAELAAGLEATEGQLAATRTLTEQLEGRAEQLAVAGAAMDRFEGRLREWKAMEGRLGRAMAQAAERHEVVQALRADLYRMFALAEETADQVRTTAALRGELESGRALIDDVAPRLHAMRAEAERLVERQEALTDQDALLARVEASLCDVQSSLRTLDEQKEFLDQVMATAATLKFQTRQAESLIDALDEGWKRARD